MEEDGFILVKTNKNRKGKNTTGAVGNVCKTQGGNRDNSVFGRGEKSKNGVKEDGRGSG